jgi:quinol monooxygenase YgiN
MPYVRIAQMISRPGHEAEVEEILTKLSHYYVQQRGYTTGYHLTPHSEGSMTRHGRVGVWESEMAAQTAAQTEHHMALRGQLLRLIDEDTHLELSFQGKLDPA